ncbi:MAG TPA: FAD-binding oxidoreductase [Sedimenticola thiotaurini]|uniref:FAD-binding oxidoreductase n=1 Tax=Sedimenticola thiotaurini TaxID=1543721 RepID=A0A831RM28_9GAMM|nr:FAD-binding oxidoreductase [Sedimenticola thiotaurini]
MSRRGDWPSWGRYPTARQRRLPLHWRHLPLPEPGPGESLLPRGAGRSYGDSCLNDGGVLLDATGLDRFIAFDHDRGVLECEAGVTLDAILDLVVPAGWFLPVTPGTRFVTVGGAIANDVHGKNHHRAGTFGCHLESLELLRSDGRRLQCSPGENGDWFRATIGGLGLTGLITRARLRLQPLASPCIDQETLRFDHLAGFFDLAAESDRSHEYTVAWVDCLASGAALGRGLLFRGNTAPAGSGCGRPGGRGITIPLDPPVSLVNHWSLAVFNRLYYHRPRRRRERVHYRPFFYPLDAIGQWNRIYGPRGFMQYQCLVPDGVARPAIGEILERIARAGSGSFLAVLKRFGERPSPGLLSFPRPGVTLALDFPNRGARTLELLERLDGVVREAGGAVYPAKDGRMSAASFDTYFPRWRELEAMRDPAIGSSFWRRVTGVQ